MIRLVLAVIAVAVLPQKIVWAFNPLEGIDFTDNVFENYENPGFANAAQGSLSGIYLGNQWFLTANHVAGSSPSVVLDGVTYDTVPNSRRILTNEGETQSGTPTLSNSDLALFRLRPAQLAPDGPFVTPETASDDIFTVNNPNPDRELVIADSAHGVSQRVVAIDPNIGDGGFATNRVFGNAQFIDVQFANGNIVGSPLSRLLRFDDPASATFPSTEFEFQARSGDSGTPVFVDNGSGVLEFGGVLHGIGALENGDQVTTFTDLGNSNVDYREDILELIDDNEYSIDGDINLDGAVDEDDLQALADGWNDAQTDAGVLTWVRGDLNQDGDTDLADFALLRDAPNATFDLADLNTALAAAGVPAVIAVPEPSAALLLIIAGGLSALRRRRQARR